MRRAFLPFLLLAGCYQSLPLAEGPPTPAGGAGLEFADLPASELFDVVADAVGVPPALLAASVWVDSGFGELSGHPGQRPARGWTVDGTGSREADVLARAQRLADLRDELSPGLTELDGRWWPVLVEASGLRAPWLAELWAEEVVDALQRGVIAPTDNMASSPDDDEVVVVAPAPLVGLQDVVRASWPAGLVPEYPGALLRVNVPGGSTPEAPNLAVVQTVEDSFAGALAWATERGSEAHFVVRRSDGAVAQLGAVGDGRSGDAVVIAVAGPAAHFGTWTPAALESTGRLAAWLEAVHGVAIDDVLPASVLSAGRSDPGAAFPWEGWREQSRCFAAGGDCGGLAGAPEWVDAATEGRSFETSGGIPTVPYSYQYSNALHPGASCQNTSIAMVLRWAGWSGTPDDITRRFGKDRAQSPGGLASVFNTLASEAGLSVRLTPRTNGSIEGLRAQLAAGRPTIVHGYFTGYGHVLVTTGYSGGEYVVNDPAGRWAQRWKGGYPYGWSASAGRAVRYGRAAFEQAIATSNGSSPLPLWYHELTGVPAGSEPSPSEGSGPEDGPGSPSDDGGGAPDTASDGGGSGGGSGSDSSPGESEGADSPGGVSESGYPWASITWLNPTHGATVGDPVLLRSRREGGHRSEFWSGASRLAAPQTPEVANAAVDFGTSGARELEARNYSRWGTLLARATITVTLSAVDELSPTWTAAGGTTMKFGATTERSDVSYVVYSVDGWTLTDDATGTTHGPQPAYHLTYTFSEEGVGRLLVARGYDVGGNLVAEGQRFIDVVGDELPDCAVVGQLACGQTVSGDTSGPEASTVLNSYPDLVGVWSGPEVAYTFVAPGGPVEFRLVDARPLEVDHDILVLEPVDGACVAPDLLEVGFNSVQLELSAGRTYVVVVDGYQGNAGPFSLAADCG